MSKLQRSLKTAVVILSEAFNKSAKCYHQANVALSLSPGMGTICYFLCSFLNTSLNREPCTLSSSPLSLILQKCAHSHYKVTSRSLSNFFKEHRAAVE